MILYIKLGDLGIKQENADATVTTATAVATSGTKSKRTKQKDRSSNEGKNLRGVEAFKE